MEELSVGVLDWFSRKESKESKEKFDFDKAKRTCRVLIIDDDPNAVPKEELGRDGYNIDQILEVDPDYMRLCEEGTYDVILLDYNGVAPPDIAPNDGFGVFDRIRARNPNQYIIALSGQTYDISQTAYLKEANNWLKKPVNLAETKEKIDTAIIHRFDQARVFDEIRTVLLAANIEQKSIENLIVALQKDQSGSQEGYTQTAGKFLRDIAPIAGLIAQLVRISTSGQ